jgi:hypothetical protein
MSVTLSHLLAFFTETRIYEHTGKVLLNSEYASISDYGLHSCILVTSFGLHLRHSKGLTTL